MVTFKCKRKWIIHWETWNVQGLKDECEIIIKDLDLEKLKINIIALSKIRNSKIKVIGRFVHFYSGILKKKRTKK